jgi:nitrogen fixation protein FixH
MTRAVETRFTGKHMLAIMTGFFLVVLVANLSLVYFASHSWTGLVVNNAYIASQEFNTRTAQLEKAEAGVIVRATDDRGRLRLTLSDSSGRAVAASSVVAVLGRPTHEGDDVRIDFASVGNGAFEAGQVLLPGVWSGHVSATVANHADWLRPLRITIGD